MITDNKTIELTVYQKQHEQQVIDLILGIQQKEFNVPITLNDQPDLLDVESVYCQGNGNFWVVLSGEKVIGTIALIDYGNAKGALRKMFVHKDFRGKETGTAQLLLDGLTDWAVAKNFDEISLGTIERLIGAIKFYLKNGFVAVNKNELPKGFPLMKVDTLFFTKKLS